jgi:hypothetical protein
MLGDVIVNGGEKSEEREFSFGEGGGAEFFEHGGLIGIVAWFQHIDVGTGAEEVVVGVGEVGHFFIGYKKSGPGAGANKCRLYLGDGVAA